MTAQSGLIARRDKSPTSTNSEGVPCFSQQLNSQCGQNAACPWSRYMHRNALILCHANRQCTPSDAQAKDLAARQEPADRHEHAQAGSPIWEHHGLLDRLAAGSSHSSLTPLCSHRSAWRKRCSARASARCAGKLGAISLNASVRLTIPESFLLRAATR
jgi:hypothetical protein